ncbi:MAG: hypothetical protein QG639_885 [Patescibacteria group bacterium]|nr:hypothetical protein [Patescibacteria group bacterium]
MARKLADRLMIWSLLLIVSAVVLALDYSPTVVETGFNFKLDLMGHDTVSLGSQGTLVAVSNKPFMLHSAATNKKLQGLISEGDEGDEYIVETVLEKLDTVALLEGAKVTVYLNTDGSADALLVHQKGLWSVWKDVFPLFGTLISLWLGVCLIIRDATRVEVSRQKPDEEDTEVSEVEDAPAVN